MLEPCTVAWTILWGTKTCNLLLFGAYTDNVEDETINRAVNFSFGVTFCQEQCRGWPAENWNRMSGDV